jgi:AhpC/TSA family protein
VSEPSAPPPPRPPAGASRYGWVVGVVVVALLAYVSLNTLRSHGVGSRGLTVGSKAPPFAAPLALGKLQGDVNVARRANQGAAGDRPACAVRGPGILNSCQLAARGPFVLAFLATRGARCTREVDRLQRLRARHPDLQVAAIAIRGGRDDLRALIRGHGWRFPVAWDRDGVLANLYGVAVCPQVTYALPGGVVQSTSVGELGTRALDGRLSALERAARARGWRP